LRAAVGGRCRSSQGRVRRSRPIRFRSRPGRFRTCALGFDLGLLPVVVLALSRDARLPGPAPPCALVELFARARRPSRSSRSAPAMWMSYRSTWRGNVLVRSRHVGAPGATGNLGRPALRGRFRGGRRHASREHPGAAHPPVCGGARLRRPRMRECRRGGRQRVDHAGAGKPGRDARLDSRVGHLVGVRTRSVGFSR
jgi:hypothetical protein